MEVIKSSEVQISRPAEHVVNIPFLTCWRIVELDV